MKQFISKYQDQISGVLSGFDRMVFRGSLRALCGKHGMEQYLATHHILYKEFGAHVERVSGELKEASLSRARTEGRPIQYVGSAGIGKEDMARQIAARDQVREGLVCVLTSVEPCMTFDIFRNREKRHLELIQRLRKCLHIYQYWMHPVCGFLNARIQTWFPFRIQICMNGREWLARQMDQAGIGYLRQDNCFPWVEDYGRTQELLNAPLKTEWRPLLDGIAQELNPLHGQMFAKFQVQNYWTVYQHEWAIDVVFRSTDFLRRLYPKLVHHAMTALGSSDVMRFLGRPPRLDGEVKGNFQGDVRSDVKRRPEGVRVKHSVNGNSVKAYDKAFTEMGSILRFETTVHNGDDFRVYRAKEGEPEGKREWRVLRRGIADLHRRAEISCRASERYMDALAAVDDSMTVEELTQKLEKPVCWQGRRVRGLRVLDPSDRALLAMINHGEFTINGLRNRDLQRLMFEREACSPKERRQRSGLISRKLRLLRAHGLLQKVTHTHRYHVTVNGRKAITAILTAMSATVAQLAALAA